jgi:hypothetical protein
MSRDESGSLWRLSPHLPETHGRYTDKYVFRLNEGNINNRTLTRLDSFVGAIVEKRPLRLRSLLRRTLLRRHDKRKVNVRSDYQVCVIGEGE